MTTPVHLRYSCHRAPSGHPQVVMRELGITYLFGTPQMLADQWWFWCAENVPDPLPDYLTILDLEPEEVIGFGLHIEEVRAIRKKCAG